MLDSPLDRLNSLPGDKQKRRSMSPSLPDTWYRLEPENWHRRWESAGSTNAGMSNLAPDICTSGI